MTFNPENDLEESLIKAADNPSDRPNFYRKLLDSKVYIIPIGEKPKIENGIVGEDSLIKLSVIERNGIKYTPFFSSPTRISQVITQEVDFFALDAKAFFELTRGNYLILNPNLPYGKEFLPDEVNNLLSGKLFSPVSFKVEKATKVMLGQPAQYPHELVSALSEVFKKHSTVKKAYLAHYINPERDEEPGLLINIETTDQANWDKIIGDAGVASMSLHPHHKYIDFIKHSGSCGLSGYFSAQKPFYIKKLFPWF